MSPLTTVSDEPIPGEPSLPFLDGPDDLPDAIPAYGTTPACDEQGDEKGAKIRQVCSVAQASNIRDANISSDRRSYERTEGRGTCFPSDSPLPPLPLPTSRTMYLRQAVAPSNGGVH